MLQVSKLEDLTETEFTHAVLAAASEVFTADQKKCLGKTRLMKLVPFTADILQFPLTRGWYRYGYFAPTAHQCISNLLDTYQSFERFPNFRNVIKEEGMQDKFKEAVRSLKKYFVMENDCFDKWVHEEMAPHPYRAFYEYETVFHDKLVQIYRSLSTDMALDLSDFSNIMTNFEYSLSYIEDSKVLELLFDYVDFWESLVLRIRKEGSTRTMEPFVTDLIRVYDEYLRHALTPYEQTLVGMNAEYERESFTRRKRRNVRQFEEELHFLESMARRSSLTASLDEIRDELTQRTESWDEDRKESFRKILSEYLG